MHLIFRLFCRIIELILLLMFKLRSGIIETNKHNLISQRLYFIAKVGQNYKYQVMAAEYIITCGWLNCMRNDSRRDLLRKLETGENWWEFMDPVNFINRTIVLETLNRSYWAVFVRPATMCLKPIRISKE